MIHRLFGAMAASLLTLSMAACGGSTTPQPSVASAGTAGPSASASPAPSATRSPEATATASPSPQPNATESVSQVFPREAFTRPTVIDNELFPLIPGTRHVYGGAVNVDGERVKHQIVFTVTDLTKEIDGVRSVVIHEADYTDGEIVEAELAFFAQADDGTVWLMGEYPEEYEDGVFVAAPTWLAGLADAKAGIVMLAEPRVGGPSYSQGWGPAVEFTDRGRVFETGSRTCVPAGCYEDVVVTDEFNPDEPDSHQLKYHGPRVGVVRVGWVGVLDEAQETLELLRIERLDAGALAEVRSMSLDLERHAYAISKDVYANTQPLQ